MSNLDQNEMDAYEANLKIARDNYSHDETVRKEGKSEGLLEGKLEGEHQRSLAIASKLIARGWTMKEVIKFTGLSADEIDALDSYTGDLDEEEMDAYLKIARDNYSHDETVRKEGKSEGLLEGKLEGLLEGKLEGEHQQSLAIASGMKKENLPIELIARLTHLTLEEVMSLK